MIGAALLALAMPVASDDSIRAFQGQCAYEGSDPEARDETLIRCRYLIVSAVPNGTDVLFTFGDPGASVFAFAGPILNDTDVKITRVQLSAGVYTPATGKCRRVSDNQNVLVRVACIANAGGRFYAARFEVYAD